MTLRDVKDSMPEINNDTGVSLKMVTSVVCLAVFLVTTYFNLNAKQTEILFKVEQIEQSINRGGRWTRDDMSRFTSEVKLLNPDIKFPDLTSIGSSGN